MSAGTISSVLDKVFYDEQCAMAMAGKTEQLPSLHMINQWTSRWLL